LIPPTLLQLRLSQPVDLGAVREALETVGWERAIVQHYGDPHEVLIGIAQRTSEEQDIGAQVQRALQARLPGHTVDIRRVETVGAQVSTELRHRAAFALLYARSGTTVYISGRFEAKWFVALGLAAGLFAVSAWLMGLSPVVVTVLVALIVLSLVFELLHALAAIVAIYHSSRRSWLLWGIPSTTRSSSLPLPCWWA
jgi:preprotein translocase subunit SecF